MAIPALRNCLYTWGVARILILLLASLSTDPAVARWSVVAIGATAEIKPGTLILCDGTLSLAATYFAKRSLRSSIRANLDALSPLDIQLAIPVALSLTQSHLWNFWDERPYQEMAQNNVLKFDTLQIREATLAPSECQGFEIQSSDLEHDLFSSDPLTFVPQLHPWESALTWLSLSRQLLKNSAREDIGLILNYLVISENIRTRSQSPLANTYLENQYRSLFGFSQLECEINSASIPLKNLAHLQPTAISMTVHGDFSGRIVRCQSALPRNNFDSLSRSFGTWNSGGFASLTFNNTVVPETNPNKGLRLDFISNEATIWGQATEIHQTSARFAIHAQINPCVMNNTIDQRLKENKSRLNCLATSRMTPIRRIGTCVLRANTKE
jgi:hypothetical protein